MQGLLNKAFHTNLYFCFGERAHYIRACAHARMRAMGHAIPYEPERVFEKFRAMVKGMELVVMGKELKQSKQSLLSKK